MIRSPAVHALLLALCAVRPAAAKTSELRVGSACGGAPHCFASLAAALRAADQVPDRQWATIRVAPGVYREKVRIDRDRVRLIGAGARRTRLVFNAVAQTSQKYHRNGWGTPGSATLTIDGADVRISGITVENDYDYLANDRLANGDPGKIANPQAVALLLDIHSDRVAIRNGALVGYQDTLFANGKRAHITHSLIAGNIDFIFGNGILLVERSEIRSRVRAGDARDGQFQSFVAAPSTQLDQPIGIVFYRSRLTREAGVPDHVVALARPWHPTTRFPDGRYADPRAVGQVSFIDCYMDRHIAPAHWAPMNGTARDGTMTDVFRPEDARFFERGSFGPGAVHDDRGMPRTGVGDIKAIRRLFFSSWGPAR